MSVELSVLQDLKEDVRVVILPPDKRSSTVVLNTDDYHRKITDLLDPAIYCQLGRDPTAVILKMTAALIKKFSLWCLMRRLQSSVLRRFYLRYMV